MPAATISEWLIMDESRLVLGLQEAAERLNDIQSDVCLDFSSVRRIDPSSIRELEKLASMADSKSMKVGLRGVNIDIYKVLKLVKLASRFSFLT